MKCVDDHEVGAKVFFIDGPGGTGKRSFTILC